jgi:hypothetical protein
MAKHRGRSQRENLEIGLLKAKLVRQHLLNAWLAVVLIVAILSVLLGLFGVLNHLPETRLTLTPTLAGGG